MAACRAVVRILSRTPTRRRRRRQMFRPVGREKLRRSSFTEGREATITLESKEQLQALYGTKTYEAANAILGTALNSFGENASEYADLMPAMAVEMEPRDAVEAMLVTQMAATHVAMTIGAVEKTRTSTGVTPQRPQRCASTNSATTARDQVVARSLAEATDLVKRGARAKMTAARSTAPKRERGGSVRARPLRSSAGWFTDRP
jgi:hypothetical protein